MAKLETAILKTLAYADIFDQALAGDELHRFLIETKATKIQEIQRSQNHNFIVDQGIYALKGRKQLVAQKTNQLHLTTAKKHQAERWLWTFKLIPWIQMVAITGSVAGGSPKVDDDIDILIITDQHRLWLSRLLLLPLLTILGQRRRPNDNPARVNNKLCLNMWRAADQLTEENHDLYTAMELGRMMPMLNRHQAYRRYIESNTWMKKILPNWEIREEQGIHSILQGKSRSQESDGESSPRHAELVSASKYQILNRLDDLARKLQLKVMRPRTHETVTNNELKFHPRDYRQEILTKYDHKLKNLKLNP